MISIVVPLYDKAAQVTASLDSIRLQTFTEYEVIIVDDGSTDGSVDVVSDYLMQFKDFSRRVRFFSQAHAGVSVARNKGIRESHFEWIAFLDADDIWTSEYLQSQFELSLKYPSCDVLASGYTICYGAKKITRVKLSRLPFDGADGILVNYFEVAACSYPPLSTLATIVRKQAIQTVGGFPEDIFSGEDLLTWARLAIHYKIAYNRKSMALYDQDPARRNRDQQQRMPDQHDRVGRHLEDLFRKHAYIPGLKQYLGLWHKMRTRIYLSNSMKKEAWCEWRKLVRFNPGHFKTWAYLVMLVSPVKTFE